MSDAPVLLDPVQRARLWPAWQAVVQPFAAPADRVESAFGMITANYARPERFYHNLDHIEAVLTTIEQLRDLAPDLAAVRLAGWLHDVVYDSRAQDNEERSAAFAETLLPGLAVPDAVTAAVRRLILCTKTHQVEGPDSAVLLDADLAILGAPEAEYATYATAIRREYAWVPEERFRVGRLQVLECFLRRERIYLTEPMHQGREAPARRNLRREIDSLATGVLSG
jgi:predicted metal-dependent HD superfamily phosphohydrolase